MEEHGAPAPAIRLLLVGMAAAASGLVAHGWDLRPLDVALWAVLSGVTVLGLLALVTSVARGRGAPPRAPTTVVLPEPSAARITLPDPAVQLRSTAVEDAHEAVLQARQRGAELDELLVLARSLHAAELDLARATLSAGGWVDPALRDELALHDRLSTADADQPTTQR